MAGEGDRGRGETAAGLASVGEESASAGAKYRGRGGPGLISAYEGDSGTKKKKKIIGILKS